uniref:UvrD-helicase domain-containing protein n=1 Tax=Salinivibrio socompensis TaxID=1510206 RepID=UPI0013E3D325
SVLQIKVTKGAVISRVSRLFKHIYIDEVQDLAGYDLDIIKLLLKSDSLVTLVGDPRQVTYLTHHSKKYGKYADGNIKKFVENELGKRISCEIDTTTLAASHRNNQKICDYSGKLYPSLPSPNSCNCDTCKLDVEHLGYI